MQKIDYEQNRALHEKILAKIHAKSRSNFDVACLKFEKKTNKNTNKLFNIKH